MALVILAVYANLRRFRISLATSTSIVLQVHGRLTRDKDRGQSRKSRRQFRRQRHSVDLRVLVESRRYLSISRCCLRGCADVGNGMGEARLSEVVDISKGRRMRRSLNVLLHSSAFELKRDPPIADCPPTVEPPAKSHLSCLNQVLWSSMPRSQILFADQVPHVQ